MNEPTERKRRHFSDDQKATVVRRQLGDKAPMILEQRDHKLEEARARRQQARAAAKAVA